MMPPAAVKTISKIRVPIALNKPIDRARFFIFIADLLTDLVDKREAYAMLATADSGQLAVFLGDNEYDVQHAERSKGVD